MTVFITLESYLVDWVKHESGDEYSLRVRRGSAESDILERYFTKPPRCADYLPSRAKDMLHSCIRKRFVVQLWKDLHTIGNVVEQVDRSIEEWMTAHGIIYTRLISNLTFISAFSASVQHSPHAGCEGTYLLAGLCQLCSTRP